MNKSATRTVTINGTTDVTISISRSITDIKGDGWETVDDTLYIETIAVDATNPQSGKIEHGTGIDILREDNKFDAEWIKKGAYGRISNTGIYLGKTSYDTIAAAYNKVSVDAMYPEWQDHIDNVATAAQAIQIKQAEKVVKAAEREMQHGSLMSDAEVILWRRNYNNVHNEGGTGYIPHHTSRESYDIAKSVLASR